MVPAPFSWAEKLVTNQPCSLLQLGAFLLVVISSLSDFFRLYAPGNQASPLENAYVLLDLFADSKGKDIERRITKAFELGDVSVESSPLYMDETILNHTLDKGVIKYWKKLVDDCLTDQGAAVRARKAN